MRNYRLVIEEVEDGDERLEKIAWLQVEAVKEKKISLIVAPTHAECRQIAGAVRARLRVERMLGKEDRAFSRL